MKRTSITGKSSGRVKLHSYIKITKTDEINIVGNSTLTNNQQDTYTVEYNGFQLNTNFIWNVSGNLQIIGSNIGSSAIIKATENCGGSISVGTEGCDNLITFMVSPNVKDKKWINGTCETGIRTCIHTEPNGTQNGMAIHRNTFAFVFSDGSYNVDVIENSPFKCYVEDPDPD